MNFGKKALTAVLALAITPSVSFAAAGKSAANLNDLETPITLVSSENKTLTDTRKFEIYKEAVDLFLEKIQATNPQYVESFKDFFLKPLPEQAGKPAGFVVYQQSIDRVVKQARADGKEVTNLNIYNAVSSAGRTFFSMGGAKAANMQAGAQTVLAAR